VGTHCNPQQFGVDAGYAVVQFGGCHEGVVGPFASLQRGSLILNVAPP
jgi:hypothetical protein